MKLFIIFLAVLALGGLIVRQLRNRRAWIFSIPRETKTIIPDNPTAGGYHLLLEKYSEYYRQLNSVNKQQFIYRVHTYLQMVKIQGRLGLAVTQEMCVLVAASCIKLTFGHTYYVPEKFNQVLLYPDAFKLNNGSQEMHGSTSPSGIVALSWKTLKKSFEVHDDNRHLGIHEMAHALSFNGRKGGGEDYIFEQHLPLWQQEALPVFQNINNDNDYLRQYAAANMEEFFAVCMEQFFETPQQFSAEHPKLYRAISLLLNQSGE
ncbi:MAG: zinc-dependent peptidase [Bacteroidota bacterium]|jgi:Mlc titration factor MtfA (ptsG expression regulator)